MDEDEANKTIREFLRRAFDHWPIKGLKVRRVGRARETRVVAQCQVGESRVYAECRVSRWPPKGNLIGLIGYDVGVHLESRLKHAIREQGYGPTANPSD